MIVFLIPVERPAFLRHLVEGYSLQFFKFLPWKKCFALRGFLGFRHYETVSGNNNFRHIFFFKNWVFEFYGYNLILIVFHRDNSVPSHIQNTWLFLNLEGGTDFGHFRLLSFDEPIVLKV